MSGTIRQLRIHAHLRECVGDGLGVVASILPLFVTTIFLGAVLVFGLQPIVARQLLPQLGGSPAVWSATSLFFQLALLVGYAYSHLVTRRIAARRQPVVHVLALAVPLVFLPIVIPATAGSSALPPVLAVIGVLTASVGMPFVVASTTGPLIQRWFSFTGHRDASDPYFLYAASNAGSLLVLVVYPFLIEPRLTLAQQTMTWSIGYVLFAILASVCAVVVWRSAERAASVPVAAAQDAGVAPPLAWRTRVKWLALAAVPAALSLGVTQHVSTDIAAIPLLWIAPLAIYLLSFVIAFSRGNPLTSRRSGTALPVAAAVVVVAPFVALPVWALLAVHLTFLFVAAVMCHSRLAEERPVPARLTEFYVLLAVGGALGGVFVSLVAPLAFDRVWEYPVAIVAALLLRPALGRRISRGAIGVIALVAVVAVAGLLATIAAAPGLAAWAGLIAIAGVIVLTGSWRLPSALVTGAVMAVMLIGAGQAIRTDRTFFGVYRVTADADRHSLVHGTTVHGIQFTDQDRRAIATSYYHASGPIGQVFAVAPHLEGVGVIGLGIGTLAAYGEPGQSMRFYEIDQAVVDIAADPQLFTFVADSNADVETVVADGRLGIASDPNRYDLIIVDAFSSDAIPVHLLTREAVEIYAEHLQPGGLLAFHITNRFVDLEPVLGGVAGALGMTALVQGDHDVTSEEAAEGKRPSTWVLMAQDADDLAPFIDDDRWRTATVDPTARVWTDDYSDLIGALR